MAKLLAAVLALIAFASTAQALLKVSLGILRPGIDASAFASFKHMLRVSG
jgi:hypothetical protein